jgi:long-chain acyl-CoA synthetase
MMDQSEAMGEGMIPAPLEQSQDQFDTALKILYRNLLQYGNRIAMRKKRFGIWQEYTWKEVYEHVERICWGFYSLGSKKGARVIIIGNNDPELVWLQWGAQSAELIVSCLYVDYLPNEVKYFINDLEPRFMICEDQEQVDKVIRIKEECPSIQKVIYWDSKGLWSYQDPYLLSMEELEALGKDYGRGYPNLVKENVRKIKEDDVAVVIYTSGTTGTPKGNMQTFASLLEYGKEGCSPLGLQPWDEYLSYASPAWVEQVVGLSFCPIYPLIMSFAEEPETVMSDLRDIGPHFIGFTGRQWEDLARKIRVGIEETSFWKRFLFNQATKVAFKRLSYIENRKPIPLLFKIIHELMDFFILRKVRDYFGVNRARACMTGGILTSPDLPRYFKALGVPLFNQYGSVEAGMLTATHPLDTAYSSIGKVSPGKEIKIVDGEICARVGKERPGYWNRPGLWEEKVKEGWYGTGDAGWIDDKGYLYYIDRISEMFSLRSGYRFSPQMIETRLRFNPYIKDAVVFGEGEDFVVAILGCDFDMVGRWAESKHIPFTTLVELSQLPLVLGLLSGQIFKINDSIPPQSRIKKFISLHKEFDPDEAELTRSRKLKRTELTKKYHELLEAMYRNREDVRMETEVTYKDGRKAKITSLLKVTQVFEGDD